MLAEFKKQKLLFFILFTIFFWTAFTRFYQLGYSHFFGDETKTLYIRKDIPAEQFFLDQRKGPVQFLAAWFIENTINSFNEFWIRFPSALANFLSVFVFFILIKNFFSTRISVIATFLYAVNGFVIAFGRTAQYQSYVVLLGLLAVYFASIKKPLPIVVGLISGLAFLAHYDAVFFIIPSLYLLLARSQKKLRHLLQMFTAFLFTTLPFYSLYFFKGYFWENTYNYLIRRGAGIEYLPSNSLFTTFVYNPSYLLLALAPFALWGISKAPKWLQLWFLVPFILFQVVISNPGTHIWNYIIPLLIATAIAIDKFITKYKHSAYIFILLALSWMYMQTTIFIPRFNNGYPWNTGAAKKRVQVYLYGFPYYRGWELVDNFFKAQNDIRGFYSNDNPNIAKFYLRDYTFTAPGTNFKPQYYAYVKQNQENVYPDQEFMRDYDEVKQINENITIFKLKIPTRNEELL